MLRGQSHHVGEVQIGSTVQPSLKSSFPPTATAKPQGSPKQRRTYTTSSQYVIKNRTHSVPNSSGDLAQVVERILSACPFNYEVPTHQYG